MRPKATAVQPNRSGTVVATPADLVRLKRRRREADLYQPIINAFAARGVYLERRNAGTILIEGKGGKRRAMRAGQLGTPDLTGWTTRQLLIEGQGPSWCGVVPGGTVVAIEVKPPNWRPRNRREELRHRIQRAYLSRVERAGGLAWVISGPEDVARVLAP